MFGWLWRFFGWDGAGGSGYVPTGHLVHVSGSARSGGVVPVTGSAGGT